MNADNNADYMGEGFGAASPGHGAAVLVLGAGLAGLTAAYAIARSGRRPCVLEACTAIGGLSRTLSMGPFRFDLGGHRFITKDEKIEALVRELLGDELAAVDRSSKIYLRGRYFDYPLRPGNAVFGLGPATILRILLDYGIERIKGVGGEGACVSLEDWVVRRFGRTMFNLYFKEYSEKVWGIGCDRISRRWVAERIKGLSLWEAVKNAFVRVSGREIPTLADSFLYPSTGIGRIAERLAEELGDDGEVLTNTAVVKVRHNGNRLLGLHARNGKQSYDLAAPEGYISTIPLNLLVGMLDPAPPAHVLQAAESLGYRDLIVVALTVDRETVTNLSWVYVPEGRYPFGRLHEPKCWSPKMAPSGRTMVVVEYFCFAGDRIWNSADDDLVHTTVAGLRELGFLGPRESAEGTVVRVPRAYPLFEVGYEDHCAVIADYLHGFENLRIAGRTGTFEYLNMDHAMASGMAAAEDIIGGGERAR